MQQEVGERAGGLRTLSPGRKAALAALFVGLALVLAVVWVGIRAALAATSLHAVQQAVDPYLELPDEGDLSFRELAGSLQASPGVGDDAHHAASYVGDPVWLVAESVPLVGANLRTLRVTAEETERLLDAATSVTESFEAEQLGLLADGNVDVDGVERVSAAVLAAADQVDASARRLGELDDFGVLPRLQEGRDELRGVAAFTQGVLAPVRTLAAEAGRLVGRDGPQHYLLLFLTPAELRSAGGLPGAAAIFTFDRGAIEPGPVYSTRDYDPVPVDPVVPLTQTELALYGDRPARLMQDTMATDDFPRAAEFAAALTRHHHGVEPSGVVAIDVVALASLLEVIGPVPLDDGEVLDASNARDLLMNGVYLRYPDPDDQNAFFASVVNRAFEALMSEDLDAIALIDRISESAGDGRLLAWTPIDPVQDALTELVGTATSDDPLGTALGVHLNDRTSAKMDFYLEPAAEVTWAHCDSGTRYDKVTVALDNTVAPDLVPSLPWYVTGGGLRVPEGIIATQVVVTGPAGATIRDTGTHPPDVMVRDEHDRPRVAWTVEASPGQQATRIVTFASGGASGPPEVATTPAVDVNINESQGDLSDSCTGTH